MSQRNNILLLILAFLLGGGVVIGIVYLLPEAAGQSEEPSSPSTPTPSESRPEPTSVEPTAVIPVFNLPNCPVTQFAMIGDFGEDTEFAQDVADLVQNRQPEFVATVGDNNYPDGEAKTIDENIGRYYHNFIGNYQGSYGPGASSNNFYSALGNHDWNTKSGDPPLPSPYLDYFSLPGNERYYNVVRGSVEIFVIDSDYNEPDGITADSVQAQWLKAQLAASNTPWQIVLLHHSPYSSGSRHGSDEDLRWPFAEWGADAVFGGHEHNYERLQIGSIPYYVNGLGGGNDISGFRDTNEVGSLVRYNQKQGALFLEANCYQLTTEFVNIDGQTIDHHTITKSPLTIDLAVNDQAPRPGQLTNYTLSIGNPTEVDVTQTAVSLTLPAGLEVVPPVILTDASGQTSQLTPLSAAIAHDLVIPAGQTIQLNVSLLVDQNLAQETSLLVTALAANFADTPPAIGTLLSIITFDKLIQRGSGWRYLDDGSDQGTAWYATDFDDEDWKAGNAPFSYKEGDYTQVDFGSDEEDKYITTYFRKTFLVPNANLYHAVLLELRRDDGAVVYLNGREIARSNMPDGQIDYRTKATDTTSDKDEDIFFPINIDTDLLVNGENLLAVEIHQSTSSSSDIFFDLILSGDSRLESDTESSGSNASAPSSAAVATATPAPSGIFYVAVDGRNEKDGGSEQDPWATIDYAASHVPDRALIWVQPGTYEGEIEVRDKFEDGIQIISAVPYEARLRQSGIVFKCDTCQGITIEGFDIAHSGPGAEQYVIQIQDEKGKGEGGRNVVLRNNILHDSYNNDIIKVNNGAQHITIEDNIFYNQSGLDSHIDVNSTIDIIIQDNIFFNDFEGSGRSNNNDTGSFIVVKDSNDDDDDILGSTNVIIRRNILLNWQGTDGNAFITIGEDSVDYYQAFGVLIENNLLLGNSPYPIRAAWVVKGSRDITFQNNTIVGDLPSKAFAMRLTLQDNNLVNQNIHIYNNIWSDPTGTMGSEGEGTANDFSDTLLGETENFALLNNLYWNGEAIIPVDDTDLINYTNDPAAIIANPGLPLQNALVLPRWDEERGRFADDSATIREAFEQLVLLYGALPSHSPAIDQADPAFSSAEDILSTPRPSDLPDIGAYEYQVP